MIKYVNIPDIRDYPCYNNVNARLIYLHAAMGMELITRNYTHSLRQIATELEIPIQSVRTALRQLQQDGLITTQQVTQQITHKITHKITQQVTQIHILSVNELEGDTNTLTNTLTNTGDNTPANTGDNTDININNNNNNNNNSSHTRARNVCEGNKKLLTEELNITEEVAQEMIETFLRRQSIKNKEWENEGDLLAHLISWCEKRLKAGEKKPRVRKSRAQSDADARDAEYIRTEQERAKTSEIDTLKTKLELLMQDYKQAEKAGNEKQMQTAKKFYAIAYNKYQALKASEQQEGRD